MYISNYFVFSTGKCYKAVMIHRFSVSNYYSINEEVVLDLRIPGTAPDLPRFRRSEAKPDIRLPAVAVLMGPNGSGKTTLLRALSTVSRVIGSTDERLLVTILPFLVGDALDKPTMFCVDFEAALLEGNKDRELFRYEISIKHGAQGNLSASTIGYEALSHFPRGRKRRLFERGEPGTPVYVSDEFGIKPTDDRLKAVRQNASVIATLAFLNVPLAMKIKDEITEFLLVSNIMIEDDQGWEYRTQTVVNTMEQDPKFKEWVKRMIQCSDLAIQDIGIASVENGSNKILFKHHGLDVDIPLHRESYGTKRFFHLLLPIYHALDRGLPAVLDEVDGDLHVDIVGEILQ